MLRIFFKQSLYSLHLFWDVLTIYVLDQARQSYGTLHTCNLDPCLVITCYRYLNQTLCLCIDGQKNILDCTVLIFSSCFWIQNMFSHSNHMTFVKLRNILHILLHKFLFSHLALCWGCRISFQSVQKSFELSFGHCSGLNFWQIILTILIGLRLRLRSIRNKIFQPLPWLWSWLSSGSWHFMDMMDLYRYLIISIDIHIVFGY